MEIKNLIKKALSSTCFIFTAITAAYMLILYITHVEDSVQRVEATRVLLFFVFSLMLAIANSLLKISKLHAVIRYTLHYLIYIFGLLLCFFLPNDMRASTIFVGIILFTIGYAIVMPVIATFKRKLAQAKKAPKSTKYEKQFSKKKK